MISYKHIAILAQPLVIESWYRKQPIPTPVTEGSVAAIPELILKPGSPEKNHRRKIKLINEYGCLCAHCSNIKQIEELTLDHIHAKWMCSNEYYNTKQNWQLLCKECHNMKCVMESSFMCRIAKKITEGIYLNNLGIMNLSEIVQEFKELIDKWNLRINYLSIFEFQS